MKKQQYFDTVPMPKKSVSFFRYVIRPYCKKALVFFMLTALGILAWVASPYVIKLLIDELTTSGVTQYAWIMVGIFVLLRLFDEWFWRLGELYMCSFKPLMVEQVRRLLFEETLKKDYKFFVNASSGQLGYWINQTTKNVNETIDTTIWSVWPRVATLLISIGFLFLSHWSLAVLFALWIVLLFTYTTRRGRKFSQLVEQESEATSQTSGLVVDALSNHLSVRVFNARERELDTLSKKQDDIIHK